MMTDEKIKSRANILATFLVMGSIVLIFFASKSCGDRVFDEYVIEKAKYVERIGEKLVIDGDTLIIVNYSLWDMEFTLSNDIKVSKEYVNKYFK